MKITRNCTQYPRKPMNTNMISNWKENDMIKTYHAHLPPKKFREAVYTKSASRKLGEETIALEVL